MLSDSMFVTLRRMLFLHEGSRSVPYKCTSGRWTIGVGRNFQDNPFSPEERGMLRIAARTPLTIAQYLAKNPLTDEQIDKLLNADILRLYGQIQRYRQLWVIFEHLSETRQLVLLDMAFNLGVPGLLRFRQTLRQLDNGDFSAAADCMMDSRWFNQVGQRAVRLVKMMRSDKIPSVFSAPCG